MGKRQALNKDYIAVKAITIADIGGINALSMRKLAAELNIQAMSLYHHFSTKDELISHMADMLLSSIDLPETDEGRDRWREIMLNRAISAKALFQEHPWLPLVIDSQIHSGAKRLAYLNTHIGVLRNTGLPIDLALRVTSLIDSYIYGYCRQLTHVSDAEKTPEELAEEFSLGFDAEEYPFLNEAVTLVMEKGYDAEADFLFGLNMILNGVSQELSQITSSS